MLTRDLLLGIRRKAIRCGALYRVLDRLERGILYLTTRVVERVRSGVLEAELGKILMKLEDGSDNRFIRHTRDFGVKRARDLAARVVEWGYVTAKCWAWDISFVRYLTLLNLNEPSGWRL